METLLDDPLVFLPQINAAVCVPCGYVVPRDNLRFHFRRNPDHGLKMKEIRPILDRFDKQWPGAATSRCDLFTKPYRPPLDAGPLPYLPTYRGWKCCQEVAVTEEIDSAMTLGPAPLTCLYTTTNFEAMRSHTRKVHKRTTDPKLLPENHSLWAEITVQRLRPCNRGQPPFEVIADSQRRWHPDGSQQGDDTGRASPSRTLEQRISDQVHKSAPTLMPRTSEPHDDGKGHWADRLVSSKWLALTQWPTYLSGVDLNAVRRLIILPDRARFEYQETTTSRDDSMDVAEPDAIINEITQAFDSVIEDARAMFTRGQINIFDQHRISSFQRGKSHSRPIFTRLLGSTYKAYQTVWKQLLCFCVRIAQFKQGPSLRIKLKQEQVIALDRLVAAARAALRSRSDRVGSDDSELEAQYIPRSRGRTSQKISVNGYSCSCKDICACIRRYCLDFCITLLDHELKGDIFDSLIVSFLAVLGIKPSGAGFREAGGFTSNLSALIKLAQFLVARRAVIGVDLGEAEFPGELLDEMQDRFMVNGSRSPIDWALKLRGFGRQMQDQTTALGFIRWSDDDNTVSFKDISLTIPDLRWFIRDQLTALQAVLEKLLLIDPDLLDERDAAIPRLNLRALRDNTSVITPGWSFINDDRNQQLQGKESWLMHRLCQNYPLRQRFLFPDHGGTPRWRVKAIVDYLECVINFLERLLLLIHLTSGQPARGTELLCTQFRNSQEGYRRTIYVENGLVSLVTSSTKGYAVEDSTRIIHRYLPSEVGEVLIYYLWLVVPFCHQIRAAAFQKNPSLSPSQLPSSSSSLLWGDLHNRPWRTEQLRDVMMQQFTAYLGQPMNVAIWRHVAIAMSRRFLPQTSFKRDYDNAVQAAADDQAGHSTLVAGNIYGRLIDAAPGFVEAQRSNYRDISLRWHRHLGFGVLLPQRAAHRTITAVRHSQAETVSLDSHSRHEPLVSLRNQPWLQSLKESTMNIHYANNVVNAACKDFTGFGMLIPSKDSSKRKFQEEQLGTAKRRRRSRNSTRSSK